MLGAECLEAEGGGGVGGLESDAVWLEMERRRWRHGHGGDAGLGVVPMVQGLCLRRLSLIVIAVIVMGPVIGTVICAYCMEGSV
jgi:hypothetical protein